MQTIKEGVEASHPAKCENGSSSVKQPEKKMFRTASDISRLEKISHRVKRPAVDIEFHDLVYSVKTATATKTILNNISGSFESGKLSAIMGPSGAGKTSLMNILIGYVTINVKGTILTNGRKRNLYSFNKLNSYIMQEDLLRPHLSVYEAMLIAAHLKLGDDFLKSEKIETIEEIINCMGLDQCRNVKTQNLSGGQRKRTSIALELVNNPSVLFLDEPTSGLDTVAATRCLELLNKLASQGRTIVCTIHQPSSSLFYMLDHVYFLANGYCIYQGAPRHLVSFLANADLVCKTTYNPADYILEIINEETLRSLSKATKNGDLIQCDENVTYSLTQRQLMKRHTLAAFPSTLSESENLKRRASHPHIQFASSFIGQFCILFKRKLTMQRRDSTSLWIQFGHHIMSGLLCSVIFYGVGNDANRPFDNFKCCFSMIMFFMYTYSMIPVLLLPEEMKLLEREYFNRWYSLKAYYAVSLFSTVIPMFIFGYMFHVINYYFTDQPLEWGRFLTFTLAGFLCGSIAEGIGTIVGILCDSATGCIVNPILMVPMYAVAVYDMGFQHVDPFLGFLMQTSFVRYGLVAACLSLYDQRPTLYCPEEQIMCLYQDPLLILRDLGMTGESLAPQFVMLAFFYILTRVLVFLALRLRLNKEFSSKVFVFIEIFIRQKS